MNPDARAIAMSLPMHDLHCLAATEGYIELGMYEEALEELQQTSEICRRLPVVQNLELCVCAGLSEPESIDIRRLASCSVKIRRSHRQR